MLIQWESTILESVYKIVHWSFLEHRVAGNGQLYILEGVAVLGWPAFRTWFYSSFLTDQYRKSNARIIFFTLGRRNALMDPKKHVDLKPRILFVCCINAK